MRIDRLAPELEAKLPIFRQEMLERGLATGPCDREKTQEGIGLMYESIGLERPEIFIWMDSPLGGCFASFAMQELLKKGAGPSSENFKGQLRDQLRGQLWDQLRDQLRDQLWDQLWDQLPDQLWDQLWDQLRDQLWGQLSGQLSDQLSDQLPGQLSGQLSDQLPGQLSDQLPDQLRGQLRDQLSDQLRDQLSRAWYGQHYLHAVAFYEFGRQAGVQLPDNLAKGLDGWSKASDTGWFWPCRGYVICTERPRTLCRDDQGRLHSESAMATSYADGWGVYAINGVRVPGWIVLEPGLITPEKIRSESNSEVRRIMMERYGVERLMETAECIDTYLQPIQPGQCVPCALYKFPDGGKWLYVTDGSTGRCYSLPVKPDTTKCRSALEQMNGIPEELIELRS